MILSDADLMHYREVGLYDIHPWDDDRLQPASYDLTLAPYVSMERSSGDTRWWDTWKFDEDMSGGLTHVLEPGEFALFSTVETVTLSNQIAGQVAGKSTWARKGLIVESAGWVDPGFSGQLTLEMTNLTGYPLTLTAGTAIAQIVFMELRTKALRGYSVRGRYQDQVGPTPPR
jgi:dCTP deaminase